MARWLRIAGGTALGGCMLAGLIVSVVVYPFVRDDVLLDRTVGAVALDWRDFGEAQAISRLQYELDHQGIGLQVGDDDCAFVQDEDGAKHVTCSWAVEVGIPLTRSSVPLAFSSVATVRPDGDLR
ncbi:MAG: hypothetical protein ACI9MC_001208 [Kiritimatiellia bacterium]|jgi:hypothetical protein